MSESMIELKVKRVIAECELHQKRIAYAVEHLQNFMPLTPERYQILTDHEVESLGLESYSAAYVPCFMPSASTQVPHKPSASSN